MTIRERLKKVFQRQDIDRMPIRLWGVDPLFYREDWKVLYELMEKYDLEIIRDWVPKKEEIPSLPYEVISSEESSEKWGVKEIKTVLKTPAGPLTKIYYQPLDGSRGRIKKNIVENVTDAKKWLSLPDIQVMPKVDSYWELERKTGEQAMLMICISEAMESVQKLMGSELFGYWLYDERELLREMIDKSYQNLEQLVKYYLAHNIGDAYGWVGPEVCIPPLASVRDFQEFVVAYDRRIINLVHQADKLTWIHCHGDMSPVLKGFLKMNLDCLNPMEPPPVGKITLAEAKNICQGRMTLEGGVENSSFDRCSQKEMVTLTEEIVTQGKPGGGFILCPSASPLTWPVLPKKAADNYRVFVETGVKLRDY